MPQPASQALLKRLRALTRKKERHRQGMVLVEGRRLVMDALASPWPVRLIVCVAEAVETPMMRELCRQAGAAEVVTLPRRDFLSLSTTENPTELLALVESRLRVFNEAEFDDALHDCESRPRRLLVLDAVGDPGNAGTLVRAAAAFGWRALIALEDTVELGNPKVVRAAAGGLWRLPIFTEAKREELAACLQARRIPAVIADLNGDRDALSWRPEGEVALVLGSEAHGVRFRVPGAITVRLPMAAGVESLNVAMAGTALMALWARRGQDGRGGGAPSS